jgi:PAS domain S-box-containing protein
MQLENISDIVFTRGIGDEDLLSHPVLNALPVAIYTCDANGYIRMFNRAAAELWGREPELGKEMWCGSWKLYHPDGRPFPLDECPMAIVLKNGFVIPNQEIIVQRPDGSRRTVISHPKAIMNDQGRIIGAVNMLVDITSRKNAEEDSAWLTAIIQSSEDAVISKTLQGIVTSWNPGAEKLFGYTASEMIGQPINKLIPPDRFEEEPEILRQIQMGQRVSHFETKRVTKQGELIDISLAISPIKNSNGIIIGASKIARDITAQKKLHKALIDEEQNTRLAVEAAELGTFDWDLVTNAFTSSQRLKDIFGFTGKQNITHLDLLNRVHPDDREVRDRAVAAGMTKGSLTYEARICWPDQSIHWVKVHGKILFGGEQQPVRMHGAVMDVTPGRAALKAIEENEERLNIAIDAAELATWEMNLLTREPIYSKRYLQVLGFATDARPSHEEILAKIHPDDLGMRNEAMNKAMKEGVLDLELRIKPTPDNVRWLRSRGKVLYDNNGLPVRILGTTVDITDQKAAFDVLQQSEERFKVIANNAPVMIWMSGNEKYAGFYNTSWLHFTGRSAEHENAGDWRETVHPDDVIDYSRVYEDALSNRKAFHREYRMKRYDGQYRWISDNAVPRYDNSHKFIGFICASIDIDDEKRFNERLKASELLFKTIANVSPVGLWMTDINGKNNFVNDTWVEWTGISISQHYDEGWLAAVVEPDRSYVLDVCKKSFEAKENFAVEFRINRKDGQTRWMLSEGGPFYTIDKEFSGFAGSIADITERKEQEILKNDFIAVASHELKTPITSIKAYTQLLAKTYEKTDNDFLKSALVKMENQINKMTKLVSDFLKVSKIESGKFQLSIESFDLNELVHEITGDMQLVSVNHTILVEESAPVFINADRERIAQVITNFLNNAVKYSPHNKYISVKIERTNGFVKVSVADKGIGISADEHKKIFERFYRAKAHTNTTFSGFGIGLYISAEIVRRHGGEIGVKSEEGKGSVFYFTLPWA